MGLHRHVFSTKMDSNHDTQVEGGTTSGSTYGFNSTQHAGEIVKSYVRESLSSLTPRHFWALSTTSLMLTCLNSHLLTYVPLPLTTSRHRQCLISHSCYYCMPAWCTLYCDYVSHPHWASTSILDIFTTSSLMLYACRSLSSQILFRNDPKLHPTSHIAPVNVLMPIFDSI